MVLSLITRVEFFFFKPLLPLLLAIRTGGFIGMGRSRSFAIGWLRFFGPRLFGINFLGSSFLGLHLWKSIIGQAVAPRTIDIWVLNHAAGSLACFALRIDCPLDYFFKTGWCSILLLHLDLDGGFEVFLEITNHWRLIGSLNNTDLYKDWLEILKVESVVSSFFQLVLEVPSKFTSNPIDKDLRVPKVFLEEGLKLCPRDRSGAFMAALVLGPSKADGAAKEDGGKWDTINLCRAWYLDIIFTLLAKDGSSLCEIFRNKYPGF